MVAEERLIDANEVLARNEQSFEKSKTRPAENFVSTIMYHAVKEMVRTSPTVDAARVVRCKNCVSYNEVTGKDSGKPCGYGSCKNPDGLRGMIFDEYFCSHGESISG